jgi:hypothetical protein
MESVELKKDKRYLIRWKRDNSVFSGVFSGSIHKNRVMFINTKVYSTNHTYSNFVLYDYTNYNYYDYEKVKNATKAQQNMEQRSLDMILKRLVNENFECRYL